MLIAKSKDTQLRLTEFSVINESQGEKEEEEEEEEEKRDEGRLRQAWRRNFLNGECYDIILTEKPGTKSLIFRVG